MEPQAPERPDGPEETLPLRGTSVLLTKPDCKGPASQDEPTGVPGIMLGFQVLPGGLWHYEYQVAAIDDFAGVNLHRDAPATDFKVRIHRVREVYHDETQDFVFPLKAKYEHDNNTLEGKTPRLALDSSTYACPPIFDSSNVGGGLCASRAGMTRTS